MKRILLALTAVFTLASAPLLAQTATSGSQSGSTSGANSGAVSGSSVIQNYHSGGTTRIESTPDVMAPSLGSGHPCMQNASMGISIIGGGISGGGGKIDYGCMMYRAGDEASAVAYYAQKDGNACRAYRSSGKIAAASVCDGDPRPTPTASSKSSPNKVVKLAVNCVRRDDGMIEPRVSRAVANAYSTAEIKAACR